MKAAQIFFGKVKAVGNARGLELGRRDSISLAAIAEPLGELIHIPDGCDTDGLPDAAQQKRVSG